MSENVFIAYLLSLSCPPFTLAELSLSHLPEPLFTPPHSFSALCTLIEDYVLKMSQDPAYGILLA